LNTYFDTGVLVKLYCIETNTPEAVKLAGQFIPPIAFTHWQEIEIRNALRLKLFRKEVTAVELKKGLSNLDTDIASGLLQKVSYDIASVFRKANELSESHSASLGCRTLDILHVAAAVVIGAKIFVTFDARQAALATKAGLKVKAQA
jgi:predicted nucleic acid-binding protein